MNYHLSPSRSSSLHCILSHSEFHNLESIERRPFSCFFQNIVVGCHCDRLLPTRDVLQGYVASAAGAHPATMIGRCVHSARRFTVA